MARSDNHGTTSSLTKQDLEAILDSLAEGIVTLDDRGNVVGVNRAACEILEVDRDRGTARHVSQPLRRDLLCRCRGHPRSHPQWRGRRELGHRPEDVSRPPQGARLPYQCPRSWARATPEQRRRLPRQHRTLRTQGRYRPAIRTEQPRRQKQADAGDLPTHRGSGRLGRHRADRGRKAAPARNSSPEPSTTSALAPTVRSWS